MKDAFSQGDSNTYGLPVDAVSQASDEAANTFVNTAPNWADTVAPFVPWVSRIYTWWRLQKIKERERQLNVQVNVQARQIRLQHSENRRVSNQLAAQNAIISGQQAALAISTACAVLFATALTFVLIPSRPTAFHLFNESHDLISDGWILPQVDPADGTPILSMVVADSIYDHDAWITLESLHRLNAASTYQPQADVITTKWLSDITH